MAEGEKETGISPEHQAVVKSIAENETLRRFLAAFLMNDLGILNSTQGDTPISTAYANGQRDAGLLLCRYFEAVDPTLLPRMILEQTYVSETK